MERPTRETEQMLDDVDNIALVDDGANGPFTNEVAVQEDICAGEEQEEEEVGYDVSDTGVTTHTPDADHYGATSDGDNRVDSSCEALSAPTTQQVDDLPQPDDSPLHPTRSNTSSSSSSASDSEEEIVKEKDRQFGVEEKKRKGSFRRKSSFDRVRQLFELSTQSVPHLDRPLSVNIAYSPIEVNSFSEMSDTFSTSSSLQRHKSNDDLHDYTSMIPTSMSRRLSTSVYKNDLYIIPSKTVLENVKFFESKSQNVFKGRGQQSRINRFHKSQTLPDENFSTDDNRKIRFSRSVDNLDNHDHENDDNNETNFDVVEQQHELSQTTQPLEDLTIDDLFNNVIDRLDKNKLKRRKKSVVNVETLHDDNQYVFRNDIQVQTCNNESLYRNVHSQTVESSFYSSTSSFLHNPESINASTRKKSLNLVLSKETILPSPIINLWIRVDSSNSFDGTFQQSRKVTSNNQRRKLSRSIRSGSSSRRVKRPKKSDSQRNRQINVQISPAMDENLNPLSSANHSSQYENLSSNHQYHLQLSSQAFNLLKNRLHQFCERHSIYSPNSKTTSIDHDDDQFNSSVPQSPILAPNSLLHRDSIVNGGQAFTTNKRWRRKGIYRRNVSLNEYLHKNIVKLANDGGMMKFQSEYPWRTFIQSSRHCNRILGLPRELVRLYESMFEIILTEKSYLSQIEKLCNFTESNPQIKAVMSLYDRTHLFGNIEQLFAANQALYSEFESAFQTDIFMGSIFPILSRYFTSGRMEPYIDYIKGQDERNRLIAEKHSLLQTMPEVAKLNSLLIVPMQRITRYPLLLKNILDQVDKVLVKFPQTDIDRLSIEQSFTNSSQFAVKCNKSMEDERKLHDLILFKQQLSGKAITDLVTANREIVLKSVVKMQRKIYIKPNGAHSSNKPNHNSSYMKLKATLILLTDLLILTEFKPKKNQYIVIDFEKLDQIEFRPTDATVLSPFSNGFADHNADFDNISISNFIPNTPTTPQTPNFTGASVLRFNKDSSTNIYVGHFVSGEDEDKFYTQFKKLKQEFVERLLREPLRRQSMPVSSGQTREQIQESRRSIISTNLLYYSDGDSRSTNSSELDYFNIA